MESAREARIRKHERIREKVSGTPERPRLSVYRSLNHIYAQIIDDSKGNTIASASTRDKEFSRGKHKGKVGMSKEVGMLVAKKAAAKGVKRVVFDRGGYLYHGRIKALAEGAREAGLEF